jgi:hypothetical protein
LILLHVKLNFNKYTIQNIVNPGIAGVYLIFDNAMSGTSGCCIIFGDVIIYEAKQLYV